MYFMYNVLHLQFTSYINSQQFPTMHTFILLCITQISMWDTLVWIFYIIYLQSNVDPTPKTRDQVKSMVRDIFAAASERDIYTGDEVEISVIDATGTNTQRFKLRSD